MRNDIYCDADDRRLLEDDLEVDEQDRIEYRNGTIFINEDILLPIFRVNGVPFYEE